jgi:general secretion pathway protein J
MIAMSTPRASNALRPAIAIPNAPGNGFTLIELLVALFIAALMFAMGYGAINQALQNRGSIHRHQQNLVQLETTMRVIEQDFVQLAPRPVRDAVGDTYVPCLQGGPMGGALGSADTANATDTPDNSDNSSGSTPLVVLTRGGWSNPTGLQRNLLKSLRSVTFRYMSVQRSWVDTWPPAAVSGQSATNPIIYMRPLAVQVTLDTKEWGKIVRIFEIAQ